MGLEDGLREYLGEGKRKVVLVGVGNPLRGDDGVGVRIIELMQAAQLTDVMLLNTETIPEAFTGKVVEYRPTHVLLLDAANFRGEHGEARLIESGRIGGQAVSTHSLPLTIFVSYIEKTLGIRVLLLGVQPKVAEFYAEMSDEVAEAAEKISALLIKILSNE